MRHEGREQTQVEARREWMQIGEVAERTALSLRTIRYYEEVGLVEPRKRTVGGFRLYGEGECERLELIKQMKPLGFTLDEMRELLGLLQEADEPAEFAENRAAELRTFVSRSEQRCELLRTQLADALRFSDRLRSALPTPEEKRRP